MPDSTAIHIRTCQEIKRKTCMSNAMYDISQAKQHIREARITQRYIRNNDIKGRITKELNEFASIPRSMNTRNYQH